MQRAALLICLSIFVQGCTPELGDLPFACNQEALCPEGFYCQSGTCVREGQKLPTSRSMRAEWINSAEMFWFSAKQGGATLVINDGFTAGAHGFSEIHVTPGGEVSAPHRLFSYGDQFPISSSVVALSDGRLGIVTLNFPNIDETQVTLKVLGVERDAPAGTTPAIETLYTDEEPFLGGVEPTYVSAVSGEGFVDLAWTRPALGGRVEVLRLAREGSLYKAQKTVSIALPPEILPLSGDCLMFDVGGDKRVVRVGYELFALSLVDMSAGTAAPFAVHDGMPVYAWSDQALVLRRGNTDVNTGTTTVSYALTDLNATMELATESGGLLQTTSDPYMGTPFGSGAVIAPFGTDPSFSSIGIAYRSPTEGIKNIAQVTRQSEGTIYSPRAFVHENKVYLAWTEFRDTYMDLWVGVSDLGPVPSGARVLAPKASRVLSIPAPVSTFAQVSP